jgi:FkbM family methyltransferase
MPEHHPIFKRFENWRGDVEAGFSATFLGVITRNTFLPVADKLSQKQFVSPPLPGFNEEYFEWIDLLESVTAAKGHFTMIELGAGYGRWLVNAVAALRTTINLPYTLIAVEPEPTHFKWIELHLKDNAVDLGACQLIEAAASGKNGYVWFYVGRPAEWYGQAIAPAIAGSSLFKLIAGLTRKARVFNEEVRKVKAVGLDTLLRPLTTVDLIDLDVQGAELEVLAAAREPLHEKVKRVHIGTHSTQIENGLRTLFNDLGWQNLNDYGTGCECDTPYGRITFQDGVQTWINARLR